jgi:hypothetical protein
MLRAVGDIYQASRGPGRQRSKAGQGSAIIVSVRTVGLEMKPGTLIPTLHFQRSDADRLDLPRAHHNLFSRLIRNPCPRDRPPRERECAEMLCAVLDTAPVVRDGIMQSLAERAGLGPLPDLDHQRPHIDTEQPIGTKRDDLRITVRDPESQELTLLWTIEVKVGAGFHESSRLPEPDADQHSTPSDPGDELVHQISNYDAWLDVQTVPSGSKAGFVISLDSKAAETLPRPLRCTWTCVTWTELGQQVEHLIEDGSLPPAQDLLARHLAGFIREHLWQETMTDNPIRFDDLALLRAHATYGSETEQTVHNLVSRLFPVLEQSGLGRGTIKHQHNLFSGHRRSIVYRSLLVDDARSLPWVDAGIVADEYTRMVIWLETSPNHKDKHAACAAIRAKMDDLRTRNPNWEAVPAEERSWVDLRLRAPLEPLLGAGNQIEAFEAFFRRGFEDLVTTGVAAALADACSS